MDAQWVLNYGKWKSECYYYHHYHHHHHHNLNTQVATCHVTNDNREVPDNINCKSVNCGIPNNIDMPLTLIQVDLFNKRKSKIVTEPYFKIEKTKYHFCFYFVFTSNIKAGDRKGYN